METSRPRNVVSFERGADYWRSAASRSRYAARYQDAAALYRKALAEASGNEGIGFEMATMYSDMQCFYASDKLLLSMLARNARLSTAYLCVALNNLRSGNLSLSASALDMCLQMTDGRNKTYIEQVLDMRESLYERYHRHNRGARARAIARQAVRLYTCGDKQRALETAKKACERTPGTSELCLYATLLLESGDAEAARVHALDALNRSPRSVSAYFLVCEILCALKRKAEAKIHLLRAAHLCRSQSDIANFCVYAARMGELPRARKLLEERLEAAPHSADLLYLLAATHAKMGDGVRAACVLDKLLALDPGDEIAQYYAKGRSAMLPFERALPPSEISARALHALSQANTTDFSERYVKDETLRRDVRALLFLSDDMQKCAVGMMLIGGDEQALREALLQSLGQEARNTALQALLSMGQQPPFLIKSGNTLSLWQSGERARYPLGRPDDGLRTLTRFLALWLSGVVPYDTVSRLTRNAWKRLPEPCKAHCRSRQDDVWPMAFALHILSCTGQTHRTHEVVRDHPLQRRISRALTLLRSGTHEMHRL